mmetsp:Transcript_16373/g.42211  ORF Transcript_16373/g.42211 Transcript_16373/m.42211 type:complete len:210 (-) Transcript_16373:169-798(-)
MICYYAPFGNLGPENIIQGMKADRPTGWWAMSQPWRTGKETALGKSLAVLVNIHLCLSDVIYVGCTVIAFECLIPSRLRKHRAVWFSLRIFIAVARTLVATVITSFTSLSSLTGSLFIVCNNMLVPILGFYAVGGSEAAGPLRKSLHAVLFAFGIYMVVVGTWGSIQSLVATAESAEVAVGTFPRAGISAQCIVTYNMAINGTWNASGP